jgi:hypothetical protein
VRLILTLAIAAGSLSSSLPLIAHHSFAAEYDSKKTITIHGIVQKVAWVNPHAYVWVDAKDENGKVVTYAFESLSPNALMRGGWTRNSLKAGDEVTVDGYLAKDGSHLVDARNVTLPDGRKVFVGTPGDGGPTK